jgi:hypothetical protein
MNNHIPGMNEQMTQEMNEMMFNHVVEETVNNIINSTGFPKNKMLKCKKCDSIYFSKVMAFRTISNIELSLHGISSPKGDGIQVPIELIKCSECGEWIHNPLMKEPEIIESESKKKSDNIVLLK